MIRSIVALSTLLLLSPVFSQAPPPAEPAVPTVPSEASKLANPVKATPESQAKAKRLYGYDCVMCHGKEGRGNGELAVSMKLKLEDFSDAVVLKNKTDGEMYYVIKNGRGQMPAEGERGKPDDLWNLVSYIRSLSAKGPAPAPAPSAAVHGPASTSAVALNQHPSL